MNGTGTPIDFAGFTTEIVSAYIRHNPVPPGELAHVIERVHAALVQVAGQRTEAPDSAGALQPAVPIRKSILPDYLVCLEDGRTFKSLKRHLRARYDLTPEQYRAKWGLASDYPMVAPNYAKVRSELAKAIGLGQARGSGPDEAA